MGFPWEKGLSGDPEELSVLTIETQKSGKVLVLVGGVRPLKTRSLAEDTQTAVETQTQSPAIQGSHRG